MKYGFSKKQLNSACEGFGIQYVHIPEVGIESDKRQELNTQSDYDKLFEVYKSDTLYNNSLKRHDGNEKKACEDVRKKYFDDFAKTKDLHFFLGTTQVHHYRARNPFIIIGTFHPKPIVQYKLF